MAYLNNKQAKSNGLIISLALNGYQYFYRDLLATHKRYADKIACQHWQIDKPISTSLGMECAWIKLLLIQTALDQGYQWVLFLDADTEVKAHCPDFRLQKRAGKCVYLAKGYSGQLNSGVMMVYNCRAARRFIWQVLNHKGQQHDFIDPVGWGENGHIIACAKGFQGVAVLDPRWNNNHQHKLDDYIRHYSYGPLQNEFAPQLKQRLAHACVHYSLAVYKRAKALQQRLALLPLPPQNFALQLQHLYMQIQAVYPQLKTPTHQQRLSKATECKPQRIVRVPILQTAAPK